MEKLEKIMKVKVVESMRQLSDEASRSSGGSNNEQDDEERSSTNFLCSMCFIQACFDSPF